MKRTNEIELLKLEIEQKQFKCNEGNSRFFAYIIFLTGLLFLTDLKNLTWMHWLLFFTMGVVIIISLKRIISLRREIDEKYKKIFQLLNNK